MEIGTAFTAREFCHGQGLASLGRWPPKARVYPVASGGSLPRLLLTSLVSPALLVKLALGKVKEVPFDANEVARLKERSSEILQLKGRFWSQQRATGQMSRETSASSNYLLKTAEDPDVGLGDFALGVTCGPGVVLPRLPALYATETSLETPRTKHGRRREGSGH